MYVILSAASCEVINHRRDGTQKPERKKKKVRENVVIKKTGLDQVGDKRYFGAAAAVLPHLFRGTHRALPNFYFCLIFGYRSPFEKPFE
jgi:hypothetical protein